MRVVFMGSPDFAVPSLRALAGAHEVVLVVTQPDKRAGRGSQLTAPAVKTAALELGLPVIQPKSAKSGELHDAMIATGAELAVVVAYGKLLPVSVLEALPRGCINVHGSILPAYRGAAPIQWAVINGDTETGVSIMQLDAGMDTGPVLLVRRTPVGPEETSGELFARLSPFGAAALLEALDGLAANGLVAAAQDHGKATHAPMLDKIDGAIDFTQPAQVVAARIRGVDPWPGAQALLNGQLVKLFRSTAAIETAPIQGASGASAGQVLAVTADGAYVQTGRGAVLVREIQAPGRKRMTMQQYAAGRGISVGHLLEQPTPARAAEPT